MQPRESQPDVPCKAKLICIFCTCNFSSYSIFVLPGYPVFPLTFHFGHDGLGDFTLAHDRAWAVLIRRSREPCRGAAAAFGGTTPTSRPPLISSNRVNQKSMQERDLSCAEKVDRHHLVLHPVVAVVVAAAGPGCHTLSLTAARDDVELCQICHMYSQIEKHHSSYNHRFTTAFQEEISRMHFICQHSNLPTTIMELQCSAALD